MEMYFRTDNTLNYNRFAQFYGTIMDFKLYNSEEEEEEVSIKIQRNVDIEDKVIYYFCIGADKHNLSSILNDDEEIHLIVVISNTIILIYKNGKNFAEPVIEISVEDILATSSWGIKDFVIGYEKSKQNDATWNTYAFLGEINYFRLWDYELTGGDVGVLNLYRDYVGYFYEPEPEPEPEHDPEPETEPER